MSKIIIDDPILKAHEDSVNKRLYYLVQIGSAVAGLTNAGTREYLNQRIDKWGQS